MGQSILLTIFIIIAALAIVLQAFAMLGIYQAICKMQAQVENIRMDAKQRLDPLAAGLTEIIANSREPLRTVTLNLAEISQTVRERTLNLDALLEEVVSKSRLQLIRADQALTDILQKVETTSSTIQQTILGPVQEASAVIKGVRSGLEFLFARRRSGSGTDAPQDEQMFI